MALEKYLTFTLKTQGATKPESKKEGRKDKWSEIHSFGISASTPFHHVTHEVQGSCSLDLLHIQKEEGPASVMLFQALMRNERIESLCIETVRVNVEGGSEVVISRHTITNGYVVGHSQSSDLSSKMGAIHTFQFAYQTLHYERPEDKMAVAHDRLLTTQK